MDFTQDDILVHGLRKEGQFSYADEDWETNGSYGANYSDTDYYYGNSTEDFVPYSSRPETYIVPFVFAIIFVIGVVGNGTLIAIFIKHKAMFSIPNM